MDFTKPTDQAVLLGISMLLGLFAGFLFDLYRRLRNKLDPGPWLTAIGDIFYWGIITVITFQLLLRISYGEVRGYMFVALAVSLFLYWVFISPHVITAMVFMDLWAHRSRRRLRKAVINLANNKVFRIIGRIWEDARRICSKLHRNR